MKSENQKPSFTDKLRSRKSLILITGIIVGLLGGYIYYKTIGCSGGTCPITSNPYLSMIWGGLMGYLLADIFIKPAKKNAVEDQSGDNTANPTK